MDVDDPADSPGGPLLEAILRHSGVALVGADRAALAQALERRLAMIELLLGFDVSSIPLETDLDPSRAPTPSASS